MAVLTNLIPLILFWCMGNLIADWLIENRLRDSFDCISTFYTLSRQLEAHHLLRILKLIFCIFCILIALQHTYLALFERTFNLSSLCLVEIEWRVLALKLKCNAVCSDMRVCVDIFFLSVCWFLLGIRYISFWLIYVTFFNSTRVYLSLRLKVIRFFISLLNFQILHQVITHRRLCWLLLCSLIVRVYRF